MEIKLASASGSSLQVTIINIFVRLFLCVSSTVIIHKSLIGNYHGTNAERSGDEASSIKCVMLRFEEEERILGSCSQSSDRESNPRIAFIIQDSGGNPGIVATIEARILVFKLQS